MLGVLPILLVVSANVLGASMAIPQARQLLRSGNTAGISPPWAAMSMAINLWWALYGLGINDPALIPVSVVSVTAYLTIAIGLVRHSPDPRGRVLARLAQGSSVALVPLAVLLTFGWAATGVSLGTLYAIQLSPAVISVYRTHDVSGVSAATWVMAWTEAVLWGLYALPQRDPGLIALAITGTAMASLVLVRLFVVRTRTDRSSVFAFAR